MSEKDKKERLLPKTLHTKKDSKKELEQRQLRRRMTQKTLKGIRERALTGHRTLDSLQVTLSSKRALNDVQKEVDEVKQLAIKELTAALQQIESWAGAASDKQDVSKHASAFVAYLINEINKSNVVGKSTPEGEDKVYFLTAQRWLKVMEECHKNGNKFHASLIYLALHNGNIEGSDELLDSFSVEQIALLAEIGHRYEQAAELSTLLRAHKGTVTLKGKYDEFFDSINTLATGKEKMAPVDSHNKIQADPTVVAHRQKLHIQHLEETSTTFLSAQKQALVDAYRSFDKPWADAKNPQERKTIEQQRSVAISNVLSSFDQRKKSYVTQVDKFKQQVAHQSNLTVRLEKLKSSLAGGTLDSIVFYDKQVFADDFKKTYSKGIHSNKLSVETLWKSALEGHQALIILQNIEANILLQGDKYHKFSENLDKINSIDALSEFVRQHQDCLQLQNEGAKAYTKVVDIIVEQFAEIDVENIDKNLKPVIKDLLVERQKHETLGDRLQEENFVNKVAVKRQKINKIKERHDEFSKLANTSLRDILLQELKSQPKIVISKTLDFNRFGQLLTSDYAVDEISPVSTSLSANEQQLLAPNLQIMYANVKTILTSKEYEFISTTDQSVLDVALEQHLLRIKTNVESLPQLTDFDQAWSDLTTMRFVGRIQEMRSIEDEVVGVKAFIGQMKPVSQHQQQWLARINQLEVQLKQTVGPKDTTRTYDQFQQRLKTYAEQKTKELSKTLDNTINEASERLTKLDKQSQQAAKLKAATLPQGTLAEQLKAFAELASNANLNQELIDDNEYYPVKLAQQASEANLSQDPWFSSLSDSFNKIAKLRDKVTTQVKNLQTAHQGMLDDLQSNAQVGQLLTDVDQHFQHQLADSKKEMTVLLTTAPLTSVSLQDAAKQLASTSQIIKELKQRQQANNANSPLQKQLTELYKIADGQLLFKDHKQVFDAIKTNQQTYVDYLITQLKAHQKGIKRQLSVVNDFINRDLTDLEGVLKRESHFDAQQLKTFSEELATIKDAIKLTTDDTKIKQWTDRADKIDKQLKVITPKKMVATLSSPQQSLKDNDARLNNVLQHEKQSADSWQQTQNDKYHYSKAVIKDQSLDFVGHNEEMRIYRYTDSTIHGPKFEDLTDRSFALYQTSLAMLQQQQRPDYAGVKAWLDETYAELLGDLERKSPMEFAGLSDKKHEEKQIKSIEKAADLLNQFIENVSYAYDPKMSLRQFVTEFRQAETDWTKTQGGSNNLTFFDVKSDDGKKTVHRFSAQQAMGDHFNPSTERGLPELSNFQKTSCGWMDDKGQLHTQFIMYGHSSYPPIAMEGESKFETKLKRRQGARNGVKQMMMALAREQLKQQTLTAGETLTVKLSTMTLFSAVELDALAMGIESEQRQYKETRLALMSLHGRPITLMIDGKPIKVQLDSHFMNVPFNPVGKLADKVNMIDELMNQQNRRGFNELNEQFAEFYNAQQLSLIKVDDKALAGKLKPIQALSAQLHSLYNNNPAMVTAKQDLAQLKAKLDLPAEYEKLAKLEDDYLAEKEPQQRSVFEKAYNKQLKLIRGHEKELDKLEKKLIDLRKALYKESGGDLAKNLRENIVALLADDKHRSYLNSNEGKPLNDLLDSLQMYYELESQYFETNLISLSQAGQFQTRHLILSDKMGRHLEANCKSGEDRRNRLSDQTEEHFIFKQLYGHFPRFDFAVFDDLKHDRDLSGTDLAKTIEIAKVVTDSSVGNLICGMNCFGAPVKQQYDDVGYNRKLGVNPRRALAWLARNLTYNVLLRPIHIHRVTNKYKADKEQTRKFAAADNLKILAQIANPVVADIVADIITNDPGKLSQLTSEWVGKINQAATGKPIDALFKEAKYPVLTGAQQKAIDQAQLQQRDFNTHFNDPILQQALSKGQGVLRLDAKGKLTASAQQAIKQLNQYDKAWLEQFKTRHDFNITLGQAVSGFQVDEASFVKLRQQAGDQVLVNELTTDASFQPRVLQEATQFITQLSRESAKLLFPSLDMLKADHANALNNTAKLQHYADIKAKLANLGRNVAAQHRHEQIYTKVKALESQIARLEKAKPKPDVSQLKQQQAQVKTQLLGLANVATMDVDLSKGKLWMIESLSAEVKQWREVLSSEYSPQALSRLVAANKPKDLAAQRENLNSLHELLAYLLEQPFKTEKVLKQQDELRLLLDQVKEKQQSLDKLAPRRVVMPTEEPSASPLQQPSRTLSQQPSSLELSTSDKAKTYDPEETYGRITQGEFLPTSMQPMTIDDFKDKYPLNDHRYKIAAKGVEVWDEPIDDAAQLSAADKTFLLDAIQAWLGERDADERTEPLRVSGHDTARTSFVYSALTAMRLDVELDDDVKLLPKSQLTQMTDELRQDTDFQQMRTALFSPDNLVRPSMEI